MSRIMRVFLEVPKFDGNTSCEVAEDVFVMGKECDL